MESYELKEAIDKDGNDHSIKELANLLLIALNDWPTANQTTIEIFVEELKEYYGSPITIERIIEKKVNLNENHNAWKQEAGESIRKLIDRSMQLENASDFEKTIKGILGYYKKQKDN